MFQLLNVTERGTGLAISAGRVAVSGRSTGETVFFPLSELDAVIIEEPAVSLTGCFLTALAENRIPVIFCGAGHLPVSVLTPVYRDGVEFSPLLNAQMQAKKTWTKQLWRKLVSAKISGQAKNLADFCGADHLRKYPAMVRSGDPENIEAQAAAVYWKTLNLFPRRDRLAGDANRIFNYAYAVIYAAFARHLCSAVLNPNIGIHHHGRSNPFALASDLMEPFRPIMDRCVRQFLQLNPGVTELTASGRKQLLKIIYNTTVHIGGENKNPADAALTVVHSFKHSLLDQQADLLQLPEVC